MAARFGSFGAVMDQGVRYFGVGGALGFDMLAAEELLALRDRGRCLKVILVLPFPGYRRYWLPAQEERAARVEARADKVVWCSREPSREAFLLRNRRLVDGSAYCIAYCIPPLRGIGLHPAVRPKAGTAGVEYRGDG